jgi:DNA-binding CsgD family transcriptional regulator
MLKILINESDSLFLSGMKHLLSDLFREKFGLESEFITNLTAYNIAIADVIILSLCQGERYTCFPELRMRNKGIIIGLVDEIDNSTKSPYCFADIVYIMRRASINEVTRKLTIAWQKWSMCTFFSRYKSCFGCSHVTLTHQQEGVMAEFYQGRSAHQVAKKMNINYKTVAAHKYIVMHKFRLKSDYDLLRFLKMLRDKSTTRLFI